MRKKKEVDLPKTCLNKADDNEMIFVLIGRDAAAPAAIRAWVAERIRLGKNAETDTQIVEALKCAHTMEVEGRKWVKCGVLIQGFVARPCELPPDHKGDHDWGRR